MSRYQLGSKAAMRVSRWRTESEAVIREVMANLPADADEKTVRKALRLAYPFQQRENHPYRMWCQCVREMIKTRFNSLQDSYPPRVAFTLTSTLGIPWLDVYCSWCRGTDLQHGCMMCLRFRHQIQAIVKDPLFLTLRSSVKENQELVDWMALRDWLSEQGVEVAIPNSIR